MSPMLVRGVPLAIVVAVIAAWTPASAAPVKTFERTLQVFDIGLGSFAGKVRSPDAHCVRNVGAA